MMAVDSLKHIDNYSVVPGSEVLCGIDYNRDCVFIDFFLTQSAYKVARQGVCVSCRRGGAIGIGRASHVIPRISESLTLPSVR